MSKIISEENPAEAPAGAQGADQKIRKQARQLAYDVRYKVKQGFKDGQKADPVSLKRAFISQLGRSPAPGPVKAAAKKMLVGETYDFVDVTDTVKSSISDVLNSVFTVGGKKEEEVVEDAGELKKFKVRVKDKKTGRSYVRMADRAKISELRKNPNIASVEMTSGGGTAYEGEKKKGEATASVKSGKGVPGDIEKVKEEFIGEVNVEDDNPSANPKKIDVMKGKNKITINPTQSEEAVPRNSMGKPIRIKDKIRAAKGQIPHTEAVDPKAKGFDPKAEDDDQPAEPPKQDPKEKRVGMMKRMILQKKMQAVRSGAGMDIVAHTELEGEVISEKKAKKDYDGDGEIESDTDEYKGSKDKAIKKAMKKEKANEAYTVTNADKKGNTPAWQGYKSGKKNSKTGKALYTAAGHVKEGYNRLGLKSWTSFVEDNDIDRPIEDQTDKQIADVTFDGGAALPATIKGCGDAREIPTAVALIKNKYRAQGLMASKEPEGKLVDEGLIGKAIQGVGKVVGGAENVATGTVKGVVKGTAGAAKKVAKTVGGAVSGGTRTAVRKEEVQVNEGGYHRVEGEYEGKGGKKEKVSGKFLKLPDKVGKGVKRNTDHRHELGKIKDAVTDAVGLTNTKRDGVRKHGGLKGALQMQNSHQPEGKMVESVGSAVDKAIGAVGDTAKVAGKAAKGGVKVASKVVKGAADAAATVAGTPIGVAKSIKKGFQKGTQAESMTDYQKLESTKDIIRNILTQESLGSAIDKGLGAVGDTAKVAGKAAKGSVKVASKVAKGTADAAATVAGTPIGVAKSVKKGWQKGTQAESVGSAVDKAVGAVGDTATVAGKAAKGSVKVGSKVAKGTGETIGRILGTPIGVAKSVKKGFQKGASAE